MIEIESRFQLRSLPAAIAQWSCEYVEDSYFPNSQNPQLRLRREGDRYMITKKKPLNGGDLSQMSESTIILSKAEYSFLHARLGDRLVRKRRYRRDTKFFRLEVAEFLPPLAPLILLDVELLRLADSPTGGVLDAALEAAISDFAIVRDVTQVDALAGGRLAGRSFGDLEFDLG